MLRFAIALSFICLCFGQNTRNGNPLVIEEKNVLSPPYFNIAAGKQIGTTATCGTEGPELFCKLTGGTNFEFSNSLHQGQVCDVCDATVPEKSHKVKNAIDGTEKWWQSPPLSRGSEYNKVNLTIHLGQVFHVAYVLIKFANSPRAGTWVLERSSDNGKTFQPWQYFANTDSDCYNLFGMSSLEEITRDDSVVCTSEYSGVVPLENGEVIVSMIKGRPGANNFSYSTVLQEWSKATDVRLRFIRTKTLLGHLMAVSEQDPTVTRRYYYSIKDISIGGRCVCNGHADRCLSDPLDKYKLKCECQHNTCGDSCEYCCPGFVQKAWRVAVPESTNECEQCNCHGHSLECEYDGDVASRRLSLDVYGNYEGGGVCLNCSHNTAGINCEQCASGYWRPALVDPRDPNGCRACDCDSAYTVGSCEPSTGRCYCKAQYAGDRCDRCAPGYYDFPECRPCDCYYNGTLNDVCLPVDDAGCPCKYNFAGKYCDECAAGFYKFPECLACECNGEGVASDVCDTYSGECPCAVGFSGTQCTQCAPGYFNYPVCQRCPCSDVGTTDEVCDPTTGECFCEDKFSGRSCDDCKPGYYGFPQCQECQCTSPGSGNNECDSRSGRCDCLSNYQGEHCDECAPEYYGYPNCLSCACNVRGSLRTTCHQATGQCLCRDNVGGRTCDQCNADYFNFPRCEECSCDPRGIVSVVPGVCLAFTTGQCECRDNVVGSNCDMCAPLHFDINQGCISCNCFIQGTLDGVGECDGEDGSCWCKPYTCSQRCSQCEDGFFALQELNYLGCTSCRCDVGGSMTLQCDKNTGQCMCKSGVGGRRCDRALEGYFFPTLYQNQYEAEDGRTPENTIVRAGFDNLIFPDFSMKGYAEFSVVQRTILIPIVIRNSGLYRVMLRFVNNGESPVVSNVTISPNASPEGVEQSQKVIFKRTNTPSMVTVPSPFVLNKGTWTVILQAQPGLMIDYLVLLPSQYYEPGILEQSVTLPCVPSLQATEEECVMFTHPSLNQFVTRNLVHDAPTSRVSSPSTAHPEMLRVDGVSGVDAESEFTTDIRLPSAGKYVLVLEYASDETKFQMAPAAVTDGAGNNYNDARFNVYSCLYSFSCRQVALGVLNDVMVFDMSLPIMKVNVKSEPGGSFYVKSLSAIPYEQWTMELVNPSPLCITTRGPSFDECLVSSYKLPVGATKFGVPDGGPTSNSRGEPVTTNRPDNINDEDVPLVHLDGTDETGTGKKTLQIPMDLTPGRYVFLVHYYNPDHTGFNPDVVVDGGVPHTGTANITYCPNADGCRAVVITDEGETVLDITVPTTTFTIVVPDDKAFWVQYILAVPEDEYNPSILAPNPIDKSGDFVLECSTDGQQSFFETVENPTEFCKENVFSLTVNYNGGGISCDCSGAGTIGGGDAVCDDYGGQCPCKPNVIGRQCDRCMTGFYGYPNCEPCDCNGRLCDEVSGTCICPPNTIKPACDRCAPFSHSFHPLAGCEECDCHSSGVIDVADRGCDSSNGQCRCKDHVTGQRCDRCAPGYFGFPDCRVCTCDDRGAVSDKCDHSTGQCLCKENVEGLQCDRCKTGSFYLDVNNPQGCTECFCFVASNPAECHSSQYPSTETYDMRGWRMLNLVNATPKVLSTNNGRAVEVLIVENGGQRFPNQPNLYWAAPKAYLGDVVGSYGGELRYTASWRFSGRGDAAGDSSIGGPAPLLGRIPDLLLKGNQFVIGWVNPDISQSVSLELNERKFRHEDSGNDVKREEMMMVLANLQALHIRASPEVGVASVMLQDVVMTTTDYSLPIGSAPGIPAVEECTCPDGYNGHSCQNCNPGYYREKQGPYLGYCRQCDCFPRCLTCDENGHLKDTNDCLYNTGGPNCGVCEDGYIGNTTTGGIEACRPCPCPFPDKEGNFADSCEELDGKLICHCKPGYTGERCDLCAAGYFGNPAVVGGSCQECNCHGNLDPNLIMPTCDPLTGECSDCGFNTGGKYCERCADGFYGDAHVARNCTACDCHSCGTEACDDKMGFCSCRPHVIGGLCNTCEPGYFGFHTCNGCGPCSCDRGALGSDCDIETGQCRCAPNVVGIRCDKCAPGYWDYSSSGCRPCNCRNNGRCNPLNGLCECPPGITGAQCDQCELSRHVLLPGDIQCSRCDSCIDDLLNDVEPMTDAVRRSMTDLRNISVGLIANQRLQNLLERVNNMMGTVTDEDQLLATTTTAMENLINGGLDEIASDMSGSGDQVDSLTEGDELDRRITKTDADVTEMCNHTKVLLSLVQLTENVTKKGVVNSATLQSLASDFQLEAKELLDNLNEESSGDTEDYFQKLLEAEMLLQKMKGRDFSSMKAASDDELALAEELLRRVEGKFTDPAMNASSRVDAIVQQLNNTHSKLRDLVEKINKATQDTNDATTGNAVNRKDLSSMTDAVSGIGADVTMVNQDIADAQQLLATAKSAVESSIPAEIEKLERLNSALNQSYDDLLPVYNQLVADIERYGPFANQSTAKKNQLEDDARAMADIAGADLQNRIEAVNRFSRMSQTIDEAEAAADDAIMASKKAKTDIENQNLQEKANQAEKKSSELLSMTQSLSSNNISALNNDLEESATTLDGLEEQKRELMRKLDRFSDGLEGLDRGTFDDDLARTNSIAGDATLLAQEADSRAQELEDKIKNAPDTNINLGRELEKVRASLADLPGSVRRMKKKSSQTQQTSERLVPLHQDLRMNEQILEIKKRIELTRNVANMIKDSVKFFQEEPTQFVELRSPNVIQDTDKYIEVKFAAKVKSDSTNGHLMYLGDGTDTGDYLSVETVDGRVRYNYKVGNGHGKLESAVEIANDKWTTITVVRWGNEGKLIVEYPVTDSSRGDASTSAKTNVDIQSGTTDRDDTKSNMSPSNNRFFIGGNPSEQRPPVVEHPNAGNVCLADVTMNNETIGLWNFKRYRGRVPGESCALGSGLRENLMWRFRGRGSYVRIRREDTPFLTGAAKAHFIGFKLSTLQDNSLVFLVGQSINQFIALEIVDGKFVYSYNFGFDRPNRTVIDGTGDITQSNGPLLVKAGLAPAHHRMLVSINLEFYLNQPYPDEGEDNIIGDIWLGGIWFQDAKQELRDYLKNIDISFRGCIQDLNFNSRSFNIQNALENIGVTRGCKKESVQTLTMQGNDYVKLVPNIGDADNLEGGLTLNTVTPTGTMMSVTETQASLATDKLTSLPSPGEDEFNARENADREAVPSDVNRDDVNGDGVDVELQLDREEELADEPAKDNFEAERYGAAPPGDVIGTGQSGSGSLLPVFLIVIGVVVGVVLLGAIATTVLKSNLFSGSTLPPSHAPSEATPLNIVQAQRTAQMDW